MPPGIGYSREIPIAGEAGGGNGPQAGARPGGVSPQEAVKILSLRVPERPSPTSIAPLPLLMSPGGAAPGAMGLDQMIQGLMAAFRPQSPSGAPQIPQLPNRPGGGLGRGPQPQLPTFRPSPDPSFTAEQRFPTSNNYPTPNIVFQPGGPGPVERPGQPINNPIPPPPPPPEWTPPSFPSLPDLAPRRDELDFVPFDPGIDRRNPLF